MSMIVRRISRRTTHKLTPFHTLQTHSTEAKFSLSLARSTIIVLYAISFKKWLHVLNKLLSQNQLINVISTAEWGVFTQKKSTWSENKIQLKLDVPFSFRVDRSYCQPLILIFFITQSLKFDKNGRILHHRKYSLQ
jgi:hypothetical protein